MLNRTSCNTDGRLFVQTCPEFTQDAEVHPEVTKRLTIGFAVKRKAMSQMRKAGQVGLFLAKVRDKKSSP